jgi:gamma-glutamyl hercynylcysteine S-oxide synthase
MEGSAAAVRSSYKHSSSKDGAPRGLALLPRLAAARARTDELFGIVRREALYDRPISERHRIIFYTGHLEAFDWNLLGRGHFGLPAFDATFDQLFAFGIDPVGGGLPTDTPEDWPAREQVAAYNRRVRDAIDERLAAALDSNAERAAETARLLHVAIEHRLMHAETLAYMLHQLPTDRKIPQVDPPVPAGSPLKPRMVRIPAGAATLGMRRGEDGAFGWDNEFEEHVVEVPEFRIDAHKVTNGEFLNFVSSGAYRERSLWQDADWDWLQSSGTSQPAFWALRDGRIYLRTMFDEIPLPLDWPAYVSHAEAAAYARWAKKELPSEAEWDRAAYGTPAEPRGKQGAEKSERAFPWGDQAPKPARGNFDFARWDPAPVTAYPAGASAFGVKGLLGNGWEWTRTIFGPFPGFEPFAFYPGYSANFFDDQHFVMKGASARTAACLLRRSFRNWFQPHYPFVYAGFRCVQRGS